MDLRDNAILKSCPHIYVFTGVLLTELVAPSAISLQCGYGSKLVTFWIHQTCMNVWYATPAKLWAII